MSKKTLGIIGKGNLIQHFFSELNGDDAKQFKEQIDKVVFWAQGYDTTDNYTAALNYDPPINKKTGKQIASIKGSMGRLGLDYDVQKEFTGFFKCLHIIIDASGDYKPKSLLNYANCISKKESSEKINLALEQLNPTGDYNLYLKYPKFEERGRIKKTEPEFKQYWEEARTHLEKIITVHKHYPLGMRCLTLLPFNISMMQKRGDEIKSCLASGTKPPLYINLVNEPCVTSNILASKCPELIPHLVACTEFDLTRLETELNREYSGAKQKAGIQDWLRVSLFGFHDDHVMVPIISSTSERDIPTFNKFFSEIENYSKMYEFLRGRLAEYSGRYGNEGVDINVEVDKALLEIIVNAGESKDRALSVFPPNTRRALYNGHYQQNNFNQQQLYTKESGSGTFLVGAHRFQNMKVVPDE